MHVHNLNTATIQHNPALHILVAEDNFANQLVAKTLLLRAGHNVTTANNGREAVMAAQNTPYDIILMDIEMPEMNGIEATEEIRQAPGPNQNTKIIALTAYGSPSEKYTYKHSGIDATLSKPLRMNRLTDILREPNQPARSMPNGAMLNLVSQAPSPPHAPATDTESQIPHLDLITLNILLDAGGAQRVTAILKTYWRSAYALMADMQSANEIWDRDSLQRSAHALKGASMNVGMIKVSRLAEQLQNAPLESVPNLLDYLDTAIAQGRKAFVLHLKSMSAETRASL